MLESIGKTWDREAAFNFRFITKRVRQYILPSKVLYSGVKAVFDFFHNKQDERTGKMLFGGKDAMKKKDLVLEALLCGELSDPQGISLYIPEFYPGTNTPKQDKNGLHLWRCIRGTGPAENAHSQYTRAFGQVRAGPMYSCAVLQNHHHRKTIRAAMAHRPGFPQIFHFDAELVDLVDQLTFDIFEKPKYIHWPAYHEAVPIKLSPFGIIPLVEECGIGKQSQPCQYLSPQLQYLASCMDTDLPYTPIATREERFLFKTMLEGAIDDGINSSTFFELAKKWNQDHVQVPQSLRETPCKVFPKYSRHLTIAYKLWRTQTSKTNRIKEARENEVLDALKLNPGIRVPGLRQPELQDVDAVPPRPRKKRQRTGSTPNATVTATVQMVPPPIPQQIAPRQQQHSVTHSIHTLVPPAGAAAYHFPVVRQPSVRPNNYQYFHTASIRPNRQRHVQLCKNCKQSVCRRPWNRSKECNS